MAPVDWDTIMVANTEDLDEDDANRWYDMLAELDVDDEDEMGRVKKVFRLTQAVMNFKSVQADIAEEELEKQVATGAKKDARKEQDLINQIADLEQKLKDVKRYGGDMASGSTANTRVLREEIRELERNVEMYQREMRNLERELNTERANTDGVNQKFRKAEEELMDVKRQNERLYDDIADYKRQLESQRENMLMRRGDDVDFRDKITKKNRELVDALEEIQNLTEENHSLQDQNVEMQKKLNESVKEMEKTTDAYMKLKIVIQQSDAVLDNLTRENQLLKGQVQDLTEQVASKADADDEIMVAVNNKVEEWKAALADKEDEVNEYREQITILKQQLLAANMDTEKASVSALTQAVEQRNKQIDVLKQKLDEATADIETQTAIVEDLRAELNKGGVTGVPSQRQVERVKELQSTVKFHEAQWKESEVRMVQAEEDARAKDRQLNDALERMKKYEAGEYGLPEAVAEIKDCKQHINIRDRQIEELTQNVNKCEIQINELWEENEDLRERLGLDPKEPIDLTVHKEKKKMQHQEDRALNQVLQKEVERLEEERIDLKKKIRLLAQQTGQRAVALGLTADDMLAIQDFTEGLKNDRVGQLSTTIKKDAVDDELKLRNMQLDKDLEKNAKNMEKVRSRNAELVAENKQLVEENKNLEQGMKEILQALKDQGELKADGVGDGHNIQCPTLERMLAAIESKAISGHYDGLHLKAQVDNLQGRTEELRRELREARHETNKAKLELDRLQSRNEKLEADMQAMHDAGSGTGLFQSLRLPEGMAVSSADVIASLNEHLVLVLQEVSLKEEMLKKMELSLENYKRKFAVVRHQQGLLYQDYLKAKKEWEDEKQKLEQAVKESEGSRGEDKVKIQEFNRLIDTLSKDDVEVRRRLSEMTRKMTILRVNEKALTRRYNSMQEVEGSIRKENNKLKNENIAMETAVTERLGYLQRFKDMASYKMASLQKALDNCVPESELEAANKQFNNLTEKYRNILEKSNSVVAQTEFNAGLEIELKAYKADNEELKKNLSLEKEKLHTFEVAMENLGKQGVQGMGQYMSDSEVITTSKKITTLEMKEINERQRAEHATRLYTQQKQTMRELEERNLELEHKFAELTKMNIEAQKVERELRDELSNCITKSVSDADRNKLAELEAVEARLKLENSRLKEIAEVGTMQAQALEAQQVSREKEMASLRQQLVDFQAQSDEKKIIGKLHRHIVQLQVSEGTAVRKLEEAGKKINKLNAQTLRLQQRLDEKDQSLYHNRNEANSKSRHLKRTIQELRRQFSGAVPLSKQEKFARAMMQLQEDKHKIEKDLKQVSSEREKIEDRLAQLELQHTSLQDLMVTLKDGKGAQKVVEWHSKMEGLRLDELKHKRQITRLQEQVKYLEGMVRNHENTISSLEEECVRLEKGYEERQLQWEQREVELERIIGGMEKQQSEIAGAASKFEEAAGTLPDPSLPIASQLETAISTIKNNVRIILETQAESKTLKRKIEELNMLLKESETNLISRDKVIAELRMRLPATAERDEMILKATSAATAAAKEEDYETKQALRIAQSTISSLQARIQQKEETIEKYQALLKQTREEMQDLNNKYEQELSQMQEKLHSKNDKAFNKFREAAHQVINKEQPALPTSQQLTRLNELEDTVAEQDNAMSALSDKLRNANLEIENWKKKHERTTKKLTTENKREKEEHEKTRKSMQETHNDCLQQIDELKQEIEGLKHELELQKEANSKAPTTSMKNLIEKLKKQLAEKEKQHKSLSKALSDLRSEMVVQAEEHAKAYAAQAEAEVNVQRTVERRTKELKEQTEDLDLQLQKAKKELRKRKDKDSSVNLEIEDLRSDLSKRESQVKKLKEDKQKLESDVEELEAKVSRLTSAKAQKSGEGETEELKRKVRLLEDELKRKNHQPEKPFEEEGQGEKEDKVAETMVARWEESKKWQKQIEKLKARLRDRDADIEKLQRQKEMLKNAHDRANKDKENLEGRLKAVSKGTAHIPLSYTKLDKDQTIQDLRKTNYDLAEEVSQLKKEMTARDVTAQEVQLRNKYLTEKLDELERGFARRTLGVTEKVSEPSYARQLEKDGDFQKQVLKLTEENIELRFEASQASKDIPRLKERIEDLQRYVEVLKSENMNTSRSSTLGSPGVRKLGESGRGNKELEKTIGLLKKVVERTQQENEKLKKAPGIVSNEKLRALEMENDGLKDQLEELRQRMGATLTERYQSTQKGTARIVTDYERVRKDLKKESETNERIRMQNKELEVENRQLQRELEDTKNKLEIESAKRPNLSSLDSKGWKSVVVTRMYEEKLKNLELEVERKNQSISELKALLRDAAEREQRMAEDRDSQSSKIEVLERFPSDSNVTDHDLMRNYQTARLTIDRLENEKREILHELNLFRRKKDGAPIENLSADIIHKANCYDKVLESNVEMTTKIRSLDMDKEKFKREIEKLKKELTNFGPEFFEEIEDLKYNYREAVQKNVQYEEQLKRFSDQFGVSVDIPGF